MRHNQDLNWRYIDVENCIWEVSYLSGIDLHADEAELVEQFYVMVKRHCADVLLPAGSVLAPGGVPSVSRKAVPRLLVVAQVTAAEQRGGVDRVQVSYVCSVFWNLLKKLMSMKLWSHYF